MALGLWSILTMGTLLNRNIIEEGYGHAYTSGYSIDSQAKEILARGCDVFIQKPFWHARVVCKNKEDPGQEIVHHSFGKKTCVVSACTPYIVPDDSRPDSFVDTDGCYLYNLRSLQILVISFTYLCS